MRRFAPAVALVAILRPSTDYSAAVEMTEVILVVPDGERLFLYPRALYSSS